MDLIIDVLNKPICEVFHKTGDRIIFEYPIEKIWNPKGLSLKNRIKADAKFKDKVDTVLQPKNIRKYIVDVNPACPTRCIDGRITVGWEKFSDEQKKSLGPKVAGGTAHAALAHRIVNATDFKKNLIFENDLADVVHLYKRIGIGFGGHVDDHATGWNTGCGAVDNINLILERLQRPEPQEQLRGLTHFIMGDAYDARYIVNEIIGRMLFLDALKPSYMPKQGGPQGQFLYKKTVANLLRKEAEENQEPVPQLSGEHHEVAVVLNFAGGKTIDSDRFSFDNGRQIQLFGWDVWEIYEEAARLYSYSMQDSPGAQGEAVAKRLKHITTRSLLGIATLMVLTDGSLKVITVRPAKKTGFKSWVSRVRMSHH